MIFDILMFEKSPVSRLRLAILRAEADSMSAGENLLIGKNERDFNSSGLALFINGVKYYKSKTNQ